jgi:hypothetical protein
VRRCSAFALDTCRVQSSACGSDDCFYPSVPGTVTASFLLLPPPVSLYSAQPLFVCQLYCSFPVRPSAGTQHSLHCFSQAQIGPNFGKCDPHLVQYGSTWGLHGGHVLALAKTAGDSSLHCKDGNWQPVSILGCTELAISLRSQICKGSEVQHVWAQWTTAFNGIVCFRAN